VGLATAGGGRGVGGDSSWELGAGVLGTAATWVASTGSRAAGGEAQTPRLALGRGLREAGPWPVFFGGRAAPAPLANSQPTASRQ
jgi:hypothetical protein